MCCDPPAESAPAFLPVVEEASSAKSIKKGSNDSCSYVETSPAYLAIYAIMFVAVSTFHQKLLLPVAPIVLWKVHDKLLL